MHLAPLTYLSAAGTRAGITLPLTWFTLAIAILVCVIIAIILWMGVKRAQSRGGAAETRSAALLRGASGLNWIGVGLLISAVPLLITLVWTMVALARVGTPPQHPAFTIDVTGRQWWWDVRYDATDPEKTFATANEIHIPVGQPVLVRLHGGDVIHSFWVPKLSGKTDTIPGQVNVTWLEASRPGRFVGQCTEYCGWQHAHMAFEVVAEPPADFERWRAAQLQPAPEPTTPDQKRGMAWVEYRCGSCHRVAGTTAGATAAPDLTHLMSRHKIAAGTLVNTPGTLAGWIQLPQQVKPGALMPNQYLTGQQLSDTLAYLETLK
ncbi:MAG TPA: cytochrome c oxidase subunit II [Steroidobacteraceae bacterium]